MNIIPALSFKDNNLVIVRDGKYIRYSEEGELLDLWGAFKEIQNHDTIYFLDLDGIEFNRPQTDLIRKASTTKEIWVDIGARDAESITDAFIAGADKTVLSTKTIESYKEIKKSIELSDELILSVDYNDGLISPSEKIREMGVKELTKRCVDSGIQKIIFSDLSNGSFNKRALREMPNLAYELYLGGISYSDINYVDHENLESFILSFEEALKSQSR